MPAYDFVTEAGETIAANYDTDALAVKSGYNRARNRGEVSVYRDGVLLATAPAPARRVHRPDVGGRAAHVRDELRLARARVAGLEAELAVLEGAEPCPA